MADKSQTEEERSKEARIRLFHERVRADGRRFAGFDALAVETILDLVYTTDILNTRFTRQLAPHRLSISGHNLLMILHLAPEYDFKMHELGKLLFVSRGNVTFIVKNLERRKLVERIAAADKRAHVIKITAAGKALLESLMPLLVREQKVIGGLSDPEKIELRRMLEVIRETVKQMT